jgi:hypothetical protein
MNTTLARSLAAGLLAAPMMAQATIVTMQLTGVAGPAMGNVYTSPYTALVGPGGETRSALAGNGVRTTIICDDYLTDVGIGQFWQANAINMSALSGLSGPLTTLKFDTAGTAAQQVTDYMTVAYLATELMAVNQSTPAGATAAGELSFAIWAVFDPASRTSSGALGSLTGQNYTDAMTDLANAKLAVTTTGHNDPSNYANVTIYTPSPLGASQEYITVRGVPEPATLSLLGLGLAGIGMMRRRKPA